ncbi:hypothetical protein QTP70_027399, partial [Hemibagrus guttatus]
MGRHVSASLTLSTGAPQGCVLSPLLYSLYTYDCVATTNSTTVIKFANDMVLVGLISDNNETAYLEEIRNLENWCQRNNLLLNVSKTKELIVDFSTKQERNYQTSVINESPVERVDSFRYLGVHITQDLSWSCHINTMVKKAQQRLYHLRCLRDFRLPSKCIDVKIQLTVPPVPVDRPPKTSTSTSDSTASDQGPVRECGSHQATAEVKHPSTSSYHPQMDGFFEHFNQMLKRILHRVVDVERNWDLLLPYIPLLSEKHHRLLVDYYSRRPEKKSGADDEPKEVPPGADWCVMWSVGSASGKPISKAMVSTHSLGDEERAEQ